MEPLGDDLDLVFPLNLPVCFPLRPRFNARGESAQMKPKQESSAVLPALHTARPGSGLLSARRGLPSLSSERPQSERKYARPPPHTAPPHGESGGGESVC